MMGTPRKLSAIALLAAVAAVLPPAAGAQTTGTGGEEAESASATVHQPVTLTVDNNNWLDVRVYALRNGLASTRYRVGTVTAHTRGTFRLPDFVTSGAHELRLVAEPIGSRRALLSQPLLAFEGSEVVWTIEENLRISSAVVR